MHKILLITRPISPPWDEASKNFAYFIAQNISGVQINLMTKGILPELPDTVVQHPVYTTAEIAEFNLEQKLRSLYFQFMSRGQFDINHYFFTPTKLNSFLINNFLTTKKTKVIQTVATLREDIWSDQDLKNLLFGDLIITYSDYAKNKLERLDFKNVQRIYPGIDLEKYRPLPKNSGAMAFFDIAENDFVITCPGEYTRLGATDDLVAMLPELFRKIPNAKFVFAYRVKNEKDAIKKADIEKTLSEQGILDKIIFTDTFSDMPKLYNLSDIVLFPVRNMKGKFDVPLVVIEGMACEKPVIISDLPILQEFANPDNSVIIKTGSTEELITACQQLYADADKRLSLGKSARKFVQENFDILAVAKKYQETYNKLLENNQEISNK